jgi:predicted HicB family RNase H-like nuclease
MNKMTYKGYTALMEFDTEDKIIVGRVIDIDDIITFHGTSIVEFETALHTAVEGYFLPVNSWAKLPKNQPVVA